MKKLLVALQLLDRMECAIDAGTRTIFPMGPFFSIGPLRGPSHEAKSRVDAASIRLGQSPLPATKLFGHMEQSEQTVLASPHAWTILSLANKPEPIGGEVARAKTCLNEPSTCRHGTNWINEHVPLGTTSQESRASAILPVGLGSGHGTMRWAGVLTVLGLDSDHGAS